VRGEGGEENDRHSVIKAMSMRERNNPKRGKENPTNFEN